jgi:hypothetical protein
MSPPAASWRDRPAATSIGSDFSYRSGKSTFPPAPGLREAKKTQLQMIFKLICAAAAPSPFLDSRKSADRQRQRVCLSILVTGYPRSQNCSRRRAIAPPHARRLCLAAGTVPSPFLRVDSRKSESAASTARSNVCVASILVSGCPRKTTILHLRTATRRHSQGLCEAAGTVPPLFSTVTHTGNGVHNGRKSVMVFHSSCS